MIGASKIVNHAFDCTHVLFGVMSCFHILLVLAIFLIADNDMCQMVLDTIAEYDLPPSTGKRH
jgi:hypothetical protein